MFSDDMITIGTSFITEEVPGYSSLRRNLLHLAPRYNFGWSHGKEKLEFGKPSIHHIADQTYGLETLYQNLKWGISFNGGQTGTRRYLIPISTTRLKTPMLTLTQYNDGHKYPPTLT
ncbi:hypothetical protein JHK84_052991 [Glycine max]|nr:hypothetical protein JHK86_052964 [Glycine max]KAG5082953.1 hypothetical protein JHK84_052991 [Glycine max]